MPSVPRFELFRNLNWAVFKAHTRNPWLTFCHVSAAVTQWVVDVLHHISHWAQFRESALPFRNRYACFCERSVYTEVSRSSCQRKRGTLKVKNGSMLCRAMGVRIPVRPRCLLGILANLAHQSWGIASCIGKLPEFSSKIGREVRKYPAPLFSPRFCANSRFCHPSPQASATMLRERSRKIYVGRFFFYIWVMFFLITWGSYLQWCLLESCLLLLLCFAHCASMWTTSVCHVPLPLNGFRRQAPADALLSNLQHLNN